MDFFSFWSNSAHSDGKAIWGFPGWSSGNTGNYKTTDWAGLLCGQQNGTVSLRLTCQRLISITCKVTMEVLCPSLWSVNSNNKCWNTFLIHCKWVSVQLTKWTTLLYPVWCYLPSQELHLHSSGRICLSLAFFFPWPLFLCTHRLLI